MIVETISDLIRVVSAGGRVLSAVLKDPFELDADNRALMCFVALSEVAKEGVLAVSKSHQLDPHVLAYQERIRLAGWSCGTVVADMHSIREVYKATQVAESAEDHEFSESEWQRKVLQMLREACGMQASDLHIIVRRDICDVRVRVHGELKRIEQFRAEDGVRLCATIYQAMCDVAEPIFKPLQAQRARMKGEYVNQLGLSGARVNTRTLDRGILMVLRLLYADSPDALLDLPALGYLPDQCQALETLMEHRAGVVLLSGPTGSGKSTTLKVLMQRILREQSGIHLLTLEDPPEYEIEGANQSPVSGDRSDMTKVEQEWANALADAMRLDPDIIMVGEIRDAVTAKMAFRAAMTGHAIWTTIHANDALAILPRLEDEAVMSSLLTDSRLIIGLVNQSLVKTLCPNCKIRLGGHYDMVNARLLDRIVKYCEPESVCLQGPGCEHCNYVGVKGRTVIAEVINTTPGLMSAYRSEGHHGALRYWVNEMGGRGKVDSLIYKVNAGLVDPRDGERVIGPMTPLVTSIS